MSNPPRPRRRIAGADVLAASLEQSLADAARHEEDAAIIAALHLRPRPGLYIDRDDINELLLVLEEGSGPQDDCGAAGAIVGLALSDGLGGWYLGCIRCHGEIEEPDGGMCRPCREDEAWQDQQCQASQDQAENG